MQSTEDSNLYCSHIKYLVFPYIKYNHFYFFVKSIMIFFSKDLHLISSPYYHILFYIKFLIFNSQFSILYTILSLSDSDKHFDSAIAEYLKRLPKNLTIIDLKPSKADHRETAIQKDTDLIIDWLTKNKDKYDQFILLSINGQDAPTQDRVRNFPFWKKYCFIIGGPHGLDEEKLKIKNSELKMIWLWKQTLVHGLAKLVLAEQIYRIWMIQQWRSYHY